jgi:hypothetical protein
MGDSSRAAAGQGRRRTPKSGRLDDTREFYFKFGKVEESGASMLTCSFRLVLQSSLPSFLSLIINANTRCICFRNFTVDPT